MTTLPAALPPPRTPSPRDAPSLRWGIVAPGQIAARFTEALRKHTGQRVVAAGSRSLDRAEAFRRDWRLERAHGSYQALVEDPGVDAVYVASPNSAHHEHALLAIAAGKPVLVEKPFACTAAEARKVAAAARSAGVLCMEAMWSRYLPQTDVLRQVLELGLLGDVRSLQADHSQYIPDGRLHAPELGGGALLDLGVYPVSFAHQVLGVPERVQAQGTLTGNGLDEQSVLALFYPGGALAAITTSMAARMPTGAAIGGTRATVAFEGQFYLPGGFTLSQAPEQGGGSLRWHDESGIEAGMGLCYQAAALARYHAEGRTESPLLGLAETVEVMETLDAARHQVGAFLPGEQPTEDPTR